MSCFLEEAVSGDNINLVKAWVFWGALIIFNNLFCCSMIFLKSKSEYASPCLNPSVAPYWFRRLSKDLSLPLVIWPLLTSLASLLQAPLQSLPHIPSKSSDTELLSAPQINQAFLCLSLAHCSYCCLGLQHIFLF